MAKYQYRRPYYPYINRNRYQQTQGSGVSGSMEIGSKFGEQVAKVIAARKQDQIANQLAAQYGLFTPRAQWVGGTPPPAGVNTQGTSLADAGGVEGLKLRMAMAQRQQQQQAAQTKANLQNALAQQQLGKGKSVWAGRTQTPGQTQTPSQTTGKPGPYKAGAYDYENGTLNGQKTADSMEMLQKDLDSEAGKNGTTAALLAAVPQMKMVGGKLTITPTTGLDKDGKTQITLPSRYRFNDDGSFSVLDASGNPTATLSQDALKMGLARLNAMKVRNGQSPLPNPYITSAAPNSTFTPGSKENPFQLDASKPNTDFRSLPFGSYFKNPRTGNIELKQDPTKTQQTAQTQTQPNVPASQFPTPSEGGTSTDVIPPPRDTGGVNIPMRRTGSSDESAGAATQPVSYSGDQDGTTRQLGAGAGALVGLNQQPEAQDQGHDTGQGDRIIVPGNDSRPIENVAPRNPILEAKSDAVLPDTSQIAQVSDEDRDLLNRRITEQLLLS